MFPMVLRREIRIFLGLKALVLFALYQLFFSPAHQARPASPIVHIGN